MLTSNLGWIGVDLGTQTVKLAQAVRTADGVRLHHAAVIQRPSPWSAADALALDEPDPSWAEIHAALECGGFRGRNAACVLPMNVCQLRGLKVPQGDERERRAMIALELADDGAEQPFPIEFDFWELGGEKGIETADGFNVNVLSVARPWIDRVATDCQQTRLDCWAVDAIPLAMARAIGIAVLPGNGERLLAIDWGFSNTTLSIVGKGRPLYARRLHNCQIRNGLAAIKSSLGVTLDHAQHLINVHGVKLPRTPGRDTGAAPSGDDEIQAAITDAFAETTASLVDQIQKTLRFIESQRRCQPPATLWLMGGGASVRNMGPYLADALGMQVELWGVTTGSERATVVRDRLAALFGPALALSALAWRAA